MDFFHKSLKKETKYDRNNCLLIVKCDVFDSHKDMINIVQGNGDSNVYSWVLNQRIQGLSRWLPLKMWW